MIQLPLLFGSVWEWPRRVVRLGKRKESDISRCDGPAMRLIIYFEQKLLSDWIHRQWPLTTNTLAIELIFFCFVCLLLPSRAGEKISRRFVKISFFDSQSLLTIGQVILILWWFCLWVKWKLFWINLRYYLWGQFMVLPFFAHNYSSLMPIIKCISGDWARRSSQGF